MTTLLRTFLFVFVLLSFFPYAGWTATLTLRDGRTLEGEIVHYFRGIFTLRTSDGKEEFIGQNEVQGIAFGQPAPPSGKKPDPSAVQLQTSMGSERNFLEGLSKSNSKFASPLQTFEVWLKAATDGDLSAMVDCYASFRKKEVKTELKDYSKDIREKMRATTAETRFIPGEPYYQGDRATLEINWQKGVQGDSQVLQFILEGEDWKLIR